MRRFVMPFGKHKGKTLDQIDTGYLGWLLDKEFLLESTRDAIVGHLAVHCGGRWKKDRRRLRVRRRPATAGEVPACGDFVMPVGEHAGLSLAEIGSSNRGLAYLRRLIRHDALRGHPEARQAIEEYLAHPSVRDARRRVNRRPADPGLGHVSA